MVPCPAGQRQPGPADPSTLGRCDIRSHTYVFLDTTIPMHCLPFHQIDWTTLVGSEKVTIVFLSTVVRELDKLKDGHPSRPLRERARRAVKNVLDAIEGTDTEVRPGVRVQFLREPITPEILERYHLDKSVPDEAILAGVLAFRDRNTSEQVALVTRDSGMRLSARDFGLGVYSPTPEMELQEEPDERDKKVRQLEAQLASATARTPALELLFEDGGNRLKTVVRRGHQLSEDEIEGVVNEAASRLPPSGRLQASLAPFVTPAHLRQYDKDRMQYLDQLRQHLPIAREWEIRTRRSIRIALKVSNVGTTPATDISVELRFPVGLEIETDYTAPSEPQPPQPPSLNPFSSSLFRDDWAPGFGASKQDRIDRGIRYTHELFQPRIEASDSGTVMSFSIRKLQQDDENDLDVIAVVFSPDAPASSFTLPYELRADDMPTVRKKVHVIVEELDA
jgi:PIN domain